MIFLPQREKAGDRFLGIGIPILVEAHRQVFVPGTRKAIVVVAPVVPFNDDQMVSVHFADGFGDRAIQIPNRFVRQILFAILVFAFERPIWFVQKIVTSDPRFAGVTLGQLAPQSDRLLPISFIFPQGGLGGIVVRNIGVLALTTWCGMQIENEIHSLGLAPGQQLVGQIKS